MATAIDDSQSFVQEQPVCLIFKKQNILPQASYPDEHQRCQLKWAVVTNVIKILTVGTAIKLSETKIIAQNKKRGYTINNTAKTKIETDGQT